MSFATFVGAYVIPPILAWYLVSRFWKKEQAKFEARKESSEKIKSLISTEQQGDFVNVSFLMEDDSVRNFRVEWLGEGWGPNRVVDTDNWKSVYGEPFYEAARHAATLHHNGGGRTNKNVYEANQDWRLM